MKIPNQIKKIIQFIVIVAFVVVVDIYFANIVYRAYEPVVKGILGITIIVLVYRIYIAPKQTGENPVQLLFTYPIVIKYLIFGVFWALVYYWALRQIIDMVLYLIKLFINK